MTGRVFLDVGALDHDAAPRSGPRSRHSGPGPSTLLVVAQRARAGARPRRPRRLSPCRPSATTPRRPAACSPAGSRAPRAARARRRRSARARPAAARAIGRASGSSVCTSTRPGRSPRPLRPPTCTSMAKVRSSARKSGKCSVRSALTTPTSVTSGKWWPLAIICVPTSTLPPGAAKRSSTSRQARERRGHVGVEAQQLDAGQQAGAPRARGARCRSRSAPARCCRRPDTRPAPARGGRRCGSAAGRRGRRGEGDVAVRARPGVAAVAAGQQRGVAAPVEEEDHLVAGLDRLRHGAATAAARAGRARRACRRSRGAAAAEPSTRRGRSAWRAVRAKALDARRGRAQHERGAGARRPPARHRARVVARVVVLLVRGVVLFVDDDQPQVAEGREHRRAGAEHEARAPLGGGAPGRQALAGREAGVEHGDPLAREARREARDRLAGEADLGHQHEDAVPGAQHGLGGAQVDLGLAAAGDAVQQDRLAAAAGGEDLRRAPPLARAAAWAPPRPAPRAGAPSPADRARRRRRAAARGRARSGRCARAGRPRRPCGGVARSRAPRAGGPRAGSQRPPPTAAGAAPARSPVTCSAVARGQPAAAAQARRRRRRPRRRRRSARGPGAALAGRAARQTGGGRLGDRRRRRAPVGGSTRASAAPSVVR